ncbi:DegV family protein [uncultured Faecalicoccus sp.]|uniref:DegV family protein n=1 Tax=uncultured Faecalicoccus sp. TaxID=1971760 RepID=UPI0026329854|nr:DegV family protein [uncultured Faecalicoccus sp.]
MKVRVLTDSGSGLTKEEAAQYNLDYLPLQVIVDNKTYLDGIDLTIDQLYDLVDKGYMPQTSMPPLGMIEQLFDQYKEEGVTDVVAVTLSSGLSGTNQAIQASAKWHDIQLHTLDIFTTLAIERYLAISAAKLNEKGYVPEEIIHRLDEVLDYSQGFLIPEDLDHLARGGRLTPMAAKMAGMLKIKPILEISKNSGGKVDTCEKVRTMSKAISKAAKLVAKGAKEAGDCVFFVVDSASEENAQLCIKELQELMGKDLPIQREPICSVIASHTGLGSVAYQYCKKVKGAE